jgi:hypothetical protein
MTAPLGSKRCHYKKSVAAFNATDLMVDGDDAPRYGVDAHTQKPIVSFDNGKTWDLVPNGVAVDRKVKKVLVIWVKVPD